MLFVDMDGVLADFDQRRLGADRGLPDVLRHDPADGGHADPLGSDQVTATMVNRLRTQSICSARTSTPISEGWLDIAAWQSSL